MKVYIFTDMEGISGISGSEFVTAEGRLYASGRKFYTWDMNACARGCLEAGATSVLVRDGHGGGNHAHWEELEPQIELVQGPSAGERMPGLSECDALILLGYHARAGVRGALLEHTYSSKGVQNMWLNDRLVGEAGIDAAIAGERGIPTILVTGDEHLCREAQEWIPGVVTCEVKKGISCQGARLLPMKEAHRRIQAAACEAVRQADTIPPLRVEKPVTLRRELIERGHLPNGAGDPSIRILDGRTYEMTGDSVEQLLLWRH